jgi:amidase
MELTRMTAAELSAALASREISATEVTQAHLDRIAAVDGQVHAFLHVAADLALAAARAVDDGRAAGLPLGPLAGVPVAVKDVFTTADMPTTCGSRILEGWQPPYESTVTRRLREAGAVLLGKTNMDEFAMGSSTENSAFGPSRNPWDLTRVPGGSSGGSAAAVAAGLVPVAHGNDGGGSIRIPAACCGLVGLKPQRGRISVGPDLGDHPLVTDGVLTRTVAETAELLDVMGGYEVGDATWAPDPTEPYAEAARRDPGRLRIGVAVSPPLPDAEVDPVYVAAARETGELLASLGHEVEETTPPWTDDRLLPLFSAEFMTAIAMSVAWSGQVAGREPQAEDMQRLSWAIYDRIRNTNALDTAAAHVQLQLSMRTLIGALDEWDVLVTPGLAQRPLRLGELDPDAGEPFATFAASGRFTPFTAGLNATGQPALMLPLFQGDDGLPTAVQLIGRPAREDVLLSVGTQLEAARPWIDRRPPIS